MKYVSDTKITAVAYLIWHTLFFTSYLIQTQKVVTQNYYICNLKLLL